jgi:hypothetical protein
MVTLTNNLTSSVVPNGSTLNLYAYEPFDFELSAGTYSFTGTSPELISAIFGLHFQLTNGFKSSSSTTLVFIATESGGSSISVYVKINPGRFVLDGISPFVYYKNEAIVDLTLTSSVNLSAPPVSTRALPPGLTISTIDAKTYKITGTPSVTVANNNYLIYGSSGSKIFTTTIAIQVLGERLKISPSSASVSEMVVGSAITPVVITTTLPTTGVTTGFSYTLSGSLPDGISMAISGTYSTIATISGTPTTTAAKNGNVSLTLTASQVRGAGNTITTSIPISLTFGETVLFDDIASMDVYANVPIFPRTFRAATYFLNTGATISSMVMPSVPTGLSFNTGTYTLSGTPTYPQSTTDYNITATNSNGKTAVLPYPINIREDVIDVVPSFLNLLSCIVSKQIEAVQFVATSGSGSAVTFSYAPEGILAEYGLNLSASGLLTGIPNQVVSTQVISIYAINQYTTTEVLFTLNIGADTFTFPDQYLTFIQNIPITPFSFTATASSGHPIQSYSSSGLPSGLRMSTTGYLSGTPLNSTSGTLTITASTGYTSDSRTYSYSVLGDMLLFYVPNGDRTLLTPGDDGAYTITYPYSLTAGSNIPEIQVKCLSFSGTGASNYQFSNYTTTYGINVSSAGLMSGLLTDSLPPSEILLPSTRGYVKAYANDLSGDAGFLLNNGNSLIYKNFVVADNKVFSIVKPDTITDWGIQTLTTTTNNITNFKIRYTNQDTYRIILSTNENSIVLFDSIFNMFQLYDSLPQKVYETIYDSNDVWYSIGVASRLQTCKSTDNGRSWSTIGAINPNSPRGRTDGGATISKFGGNIFVGGNGSDGSPIAYTSNEGDTWNYSTGISATYGEIQCFCFDNPSLLLAGGSETAVSTDLMPVTFHNNTIFYSTDGSNWSSATTPTDMNFICTSIRYFSNQWIANGKNYDGVDIKNSIVYSGDGSNWTTAYNLTTDILGKPWIDGSNIYIVAQDIGSYKVKRANFPFSGLVSWANVSTSLTDITGTVTNSVGSYWIRPYGTFFDTTLAFDGFIVSEKFKFMAPTQTVFNIYQYVPITPISVAIGMRTDVELPLVQAFPPDAYIFVDLDTIPTGLTYNQLTCILSGTPIEAGNFSITFYAQNSATASTFYKAILTLSLVVSYPLVVKKLDGAGAVTSLVRQQAMANGSERARDANVFPDRGYILGAFSAPLGVDVTTTVIPTSCR